MNFLMLPIVFIGLVVPGVVAAAAPGVSVGMSPFFAALSWLIAFVIWFFVASLALGLLGLIFWILMLVDCAKRQFPQQAPWLVGLIASLFFGIHWLIALIYFLVVRYPQGPPPPPPSAGPVAGAADDKNQAAL